MSREHSKFHTNKYTEQLRCIRAEIVHYLAKKNIFFCVVIEEILRTGCELGYLLVLFMFIQKANRLNNQLGVPLGLQTKPSAQKKTWLRSRSGQTWGGRMRRSGLVCVGDVLYLIRERALMNISGQIIFCYTMGPGHLSINF